MRSRLIGLGAAAALAAGISMLPTGPYQDGVDRARPDPSPRQDDEKTSRQRKRWLQKQARKITARNR